MPTQSLQTQDNEQIESEFCKDLSASCKLEEDDCTCVHIIDINSKFSGKTVRFVLSSLNTTKDFSFAHPIHLHGHSFHVVRVGYGSYAADNRIDQPTPDITCGAPCLTTPRWATDKTPCNIEITNKTIRKDTVVVPAGGYVVIDFIADNPGYWFLHCHIESHQLEGMAVVINETEAEQNPPPDGMPTCGNFQWTVEEFTEKQKFSPNENKQSHNGLKIAVGAAVSAAVGAAVIIVIIIFWVLCLFRVRQRRYSLVPNNVI